VAEYRYASTDVVTGRLLSDELPLHVASFARQLGLATDLTGYLDLTPANAVYLASGALEPRRTMLWVLEDGYPVWNGVLWDTPTTTLLDNRMPIAAKTLESLFARRLIRDALTYTGLDYCEVWRRLVLYATSPALKGPAAAVGGLSLQGTLLGSTVTTSYAPGDLKAVGGAQTDLATAGDFEATFEPVLDAGGNLATVARLGHRLGQPYPGSGLRLAFPGNLGDYGWPRMGSAGANTVIATAPANLAAAGTWSSNAAGGHGVDEADLSAGYPLLEASVQYSGAAVTAQAQIDAYADGYLGITGKSPTVPVAVLDTSAPSAPRIKQIGLGDYAALAATSSLHPARADGSPGLQQVVRVIGWAVVPPDDGQDGKITLTLGDVSA
jgi:hypothetical protein